MSKTLLRNVFIDYKAIELHSIAGYIFQKFHQVYNANKLVNLHH